QRKEDARNLTSLRARRWFLVGSTTEASAAKMFASARKNFVEVCDVCRAAKRRGKSRFTAKLFSRRRSRATQTRAHHSPTRSDDFGLFAKRNFAGASVDPPFRETRAHRYGDGAATAALPSAERPAEVHTSATYAWAPHLFYLR